MATILDNYRNLQNNYRSQIAANSLPLEDNLKMQEVNYRICVLETFEALSKSAPITTDPKVMGYHYQLVDGYVKFVLTERKFGPITINCRTMMCRRALMPGHTYSIFVRKV